MHEYKIISTIGNCFQITYVKITGNMTFKNAQSFVGMFNHVWLVELIK